MTARFEIVRTDAVQPWHVREVAGNAQKTWSTENFTRKQGAERSLCRLAERFGWRDVSLVWDSEESGHLETAPDVVVCSVRLTDERTPPPPTPDITARAFGGWI